MEKIRLNKAISILGICSRRDADVHIKNGLVCVNGNIVNDLGTKISEHDLIFFDGHEYSLEKDTPKLKVWLYYKKRGLIVSHKCEKNRPTIFDDVKNKIPERIISVGRLDLDSEGLIILTNNNEFARHAESPQTGWPRTYSVKFYGILQKNMINEIEKGIAIDGIQYAPIKIVGNFNKTNLNEWCEMTLTEGKNREIRRIFDHFGLIVNRLIRTQYGPYSLSDMKIGEVRKVKVQ